MQKSSERNDFKADAARISCALCSSIPNQCVAEAVLQTREDWARASILVSSNGARASTSFKRRGAVLTIGVITVDMAAIVLRDPLAQQINDAVLEVDGCRCLVTTFTQACVQF